MGSQFDLDTPRCDRSRLVQVIRKLDSAGRSGKQLTLTDDEIAGLTENARRVARKYWELKDSGRSVASVANQLGRPRWRFLKQAPEARDMLREVAQDAGLSIAYDES